MRSRVLALTAALVLTACGDKGTDGPKNPSDSQVDVRKARELIIQADEARERGDFDQARAFLTNADPLADVTVRDEIRVSRELVDEVQAKAFAEDIVNAAEDGRCEEAIADTFTVVKMSTGLALFIRRFSSESIAECLEAEIDNDELAKVRTQLSAEQTEESLDSKSFKAVKKKLRKAVAKELKQAVAEPFKDGDWKTVIVKTDELVAAGIAGDDEKAKVIENIQEAVTEEIRALHEEAMGESKGATSALERIDELVALAWGDKAPDKIAQRRKELAFWIACDSVNCKPSSPGKVWTDGHVKLRPVKDPRGDGGGEVIEHGTLLWEIAHAPGWVLVALKDPGELEGIGARANPAAGWLKDAETKNEDTSEALPPGASLVGTRVWGPFRKGEKNYELGTVLKVKGAKATVQRMADREEIDVPRSQLRFGLVKKGTKVLGYCQSFTKLEPALVEAAKLTNLQHSADPLVTLACLDADGKPTGEKKEGQLGSVRIDPAWLPPRR